MKLTLLGTGTSQGVPVIGCDCAVCSSDDPRDKRLRTSALLQAGDTTLLIDAGPDFRQQMLRLGIRDLSAILLTHEHNDHVIGLDDVRPFNFRSGRPMAVYTLHRVAEEVRRRFDYVFTNSIPGLPKLELISIHKDSILDVAGVRVQALEVMHGALPILAFRFGDLAYITDVKTIRPAEMEKLRGLKYLIVSALQFKPHSGHMSVDEALELVAELRPGYTWLTHLSHHLGLSREIGPKLPKGVGLAYDGLVIDF